MSERSDFVARLAQQLIGTWPEGMSADDALGFVVGLTEAAFPPEPEAAPRVEIPATLTLSPNGQVEGELQLGAGGVNLAEPRGSRNKPPSPIDALPKAMATDDAELEEAAAGWRPPRAPDERDLLEEELEEADAELREAEARTIAEEDQPRGLEHGDGEGEWRPWSRDEDSLLRRLRACTPPVEWPDVVAQFTGRTKGALYQRVQTLKKKDQWYLEVTDRVLTAASGSASSLGGAI